MNTTLLLMSQYEKATIPLEEICEPFFGCRGHTAVQKARAGSLPIPAFRMGASQKSRWMVHVSDLADFIDRRREDAKAHWIGEGSF